MYILVSNRKDNSTMAKLYKMKNRGLYQVQFKNPEKIGTKNPWDREYHNNKKQAKAALAKYNYIEMCLKTGSNDWKRIYYKCDRKTVGECYDFFQQQVLDEKLNHLTEKRYQCSMSSFLQAFPKETMVASIRTKKVTIDGKIKTGLDIYKSMMNHLSRNTVNSNIRDLRTIFEYCRTEQFITEEIITKNDKYKKADLPALEKKVWTPGELITLETHPGISEFDRDVIRIYYLTGCLANELTGYNYKNREKELHWHHINFQTNEISVLEKSGKIRTKTYAVDDVMDILKKWRERGDKKPLNFSYETLKNVIKRVNLTTNIKFTLHDLRRLNAQLIRPKLGVRGAAISLGNSSLNVVQDHYADTSREEKIKVNDALMETRKNWLQAAEA